jgi:Concanavalin A-like lectin/glucanases superfamily
MGMRNGFHWFNRPPIGSQVDLTNPLSRGLVQCWLFNEGGGPLFSPTPGGLVLSPSSSGLTWIGGKDGPAVKFNGSSGYFQTSTPAVTSGTITMSAWVYLPANLSTYATIVGLDSSSAYVQLGAGYPSGNDAYFNIDSSGLYSASYTSLSLNTWTYLAGVLTGGKAVIYVNGVPEGFSSSGATIPSGLIETQIGAILPTGSRTNWWPGYIANVKIWNRSLSTQEIVQDYAEPYAVIQPPNQRRWVVAGSPGFSPALIQRRRRMWTAPKWNPDIYDF